MRTLRWMVVPALVPVAVTGCGSPSGPTKPNGADVIVESPAGSAPLTGAKLDRARRVIGGAQISPDGRLEARHVDSRIVITSAAGEQLDWFAAGSERRDPPMDFSPDNRYLAVATPDSIILYDIATGTPRTVPSRQLVKIRFSADSSYLVGEEFVKGRTGRFTLMDLRSRQRITSPEAPRIQQQNDPRVLFKADELAVFDRGNRVVIAGEGGFLIWSAQSQSFDWVPCGCLPDAATVDREGRHVAFLDPDGGVSLWEVASRREISRWRLPTLAPGGPQTRYLGASVTFAEGGRWLLTALGDGQVWSVPDGRQVGSWQGNPS